MADYVDAHRSDSHDQELLTARIKSPILAVAAENAANSLA
jgi:hypothetical protein